MITGEQNPYYIIIVSASVGGSAAALINVIAGFITRHLEAKRQIREIAIKAAFDSWRHHSQLKVEAFKAGNITGDTDVLPPNTYLAHTLRLVGIAANTGISLEEAARRIYGLRDIDKSDKSQPKD